MGNIFPTFSKNKKDGHHRHPSSISSTSSKRKSKKNSIADGSNGPISKPDTVIPYQLTNDDFRNMNTNNVDQQTSNQQQSTSDRSPFQRDFYPPPHEMLVPLEKYRPRRSNIRRSARTKNNNNQQHQLQLTNEQTINDFDKDENQLNEPTIDYEKNMEKNSEQKLDDVDETLDELDPSERTKVARTKIGEMLRRQQQQPMNGQYLQRKYQSVFEPNLDCFQTSNDDPNETSDMENKNHNHGYIIMANGEENEDDENRDHHHQQQQQNGIVQLRPRKPLAMTRGNAMLIDELKKRQSHFYDSRNHHHHQNDHYNLVSKSVYAPVQSN